MKAKMWISSKKTLYITGHMLEFNNIEFFKAREATESIWKIESYTSSFMTSTNVTANSLTADCLHFIARDSDNGFLDRVAF